VSDQDHNLHARIASAIHDRLTEDTEPMNGADAYRLEQSITSQMQPEVLLQTGRGASFEEAVDQAYSRLDVAEQSLRYSQDYRLIGMIIGPQFRLILIVVWVFTTLWLLTSFLLLPLYGYSSDEDGLVIDLRIRLHGMMGLAAFAGAIWGEWHRHRTRNLAEQGNHVSAIRLAENSLLGLLYGFAISAIVAAIDMTYVSILTGHMQSILIAGVLGLIGIAMLFWRPMRRSSRPS